MKEAKSTLSARYRISNGDKFNLRRCDPREIAAFTSSEHAKDALAAGIERLRHLQAKLYAQEQTALLLIFQAMDAAGKDGTISHVMSGVNPQGCEVTAFKAPTGLELRHDYLWRATAALPERGRIGIFNRSYYEEVLVVRVHPETLAQEKLPPKLQEKRHFWRDRFEDINAYERHLTRNGTVIRKFFLHVSKEEQRRRFLSRLEEPNKNWKFSLADARERTFWDDYQTAYEKMIRHTATRHAPWHVIPADNKWFTRLVVLSAIVEALESLDLEFPTVSASQKKELAAARKALENERK